MKNSSFYKDLVSGLSDTPKRIPCKYFYDEAGSQLFEQICQLPEYYITRTEIELLKQIQPELRDLLPRNMHIIEPGSGSGIKTNLLLEHLNSPESLTLIDISREILESSVQDLQAQHQGLDVHAIHSDFSNLSNTAANKIPHKNRLLFFPGSTIGNFEPQKAVELMNKFGQLVGQGGYLLIGVDTVKETSTLESAYDDKAGVTAEFNLNLLKRANVELDANFELGQFQHKASFDNQSKKIEMHLVSKTQQKVKINGHQFEFAAGEKIHTEDSHKYYPQDFTNLASQAGFNKVKTWLDDKMLFSLHLLQYQPGIVGYGEQ